MNCNDSFSPDPPFSRRIKRQGTELSIIASRSKVNTYRSRNSEHSISILMLESFLSDLCKSISSTNTISSHHYDQVSSMRKILNDCMYLSNITSEFYSQVESALSLISKIYEYSCVSLIPDLVSLLYHIFEQISSYKYISSSVSIPIKAIKPSSLSDLQKQLKVKINRVTPRTINIWRKILSPIKELEKVSYGFLKFYSEVDAEVPNMGYEEPISAMYRYARNPGHVVQVVRKTVVVLDGEMISVRIAREINEILQKMPPEVIASVDKTMSGYILWDLIRSALSYYKTYSMYHYGIDIYDKDLIIDEHEFSIKNCDLSRVSEGAYLKRKKKSAVKKTFFSNAKNIEDTLRSSSSSPLKQSRLLTAYNKPKVSNSNFSAIKSPKESLNPKTDPNSSIKQPEQKKKKHSHNVKDINYDSNQNSDDYEAYVAERFQEFLIEKLKQKSTKYSDWREKKAELLLEFTDYIELLDNERISQLWDKDNFTKETSRLFSRVSL